MQRMMEKNELRSWIIFSVLSLGSVCSFFLRLSTGVLGPSLMVDLQLNAEQLGILAGAFFYAFAAAQIPVGLALDTFSPKYVLMTTLTLAIAGSALFAYATSFEHALWGRILIGLGMSSMLMGGMKIISQYFRPDQFAFVSGTMISLGSVGAFIAATPLIYSASLIGWRNCFVVSSFFLMLLFLVIILLIKDHVDHANSANQVQSRGVLLKNNLLSSSKTIFSDGNFWLISASAFIRYGSLVTVQGFLGTLYLIEVMQYSAQTSANILGMLSIGYFVGTPIMGKVSDSILNSRKRVMVIGLFIYLCCMSFFLFDINSEWLWFVIFFALGFFSSNGAVSYAHVKELFPKEMSGFALTANNLFTMGGVAVSQQVIGAVISRFPKTTTGYVPEAYHSAYEILFASCVAGLLLYIFTRDTRPLVSAQ